MNTRSKIERQFDRLNQKYWQGRLPTYTVIESDEYGGHGLCQRAQRRIHIQAGLGSRLKRKVLLHEMCHAATRGGHGKPWQNEMLRIAKLGAPTKREALDYNDPLKTYPASAILADFWDAGFQKASWRAMRQELYRYGQIDKHGQPESPAAARFIAKLRAQHRAGLSERAEMDRAQERLRSKIASQVAA